MYNEDINHEHSTKRKLFKNKKVFILLLLTFFIALGTSFALWQLTFTQTGTNVITTGCLKLTLTEDTDAINLTDATPISDEEGKKLTPFTFTLENTCTTETAYVMNLETVSSGTKILADNYVKASLLKGTEEVFLDKLLESHQNEEKVITDASAAYMLNRGKLSSNEKIQFSLRLWLSEDTGPVDEVMEASWQGKVTVTATYIPKVKNLMIPMEENVIDDQGMIYSEINRTYSQNSKYSISKVVYQSEINPIENATEIADFSVAQDGTISGYYVQDNGCNTYTLYIQANGKIKVNQQASRYGFIKCTGKYEECYNSSGEIEGLENLDISMVTDMSYMFYFSPIESFDFKDWNTSKVTNMEGMFNGCGNLTSLDLNSLDTRQVTTMAHMFDKCYYLQNLDLSPLDTSKVTNMSSMFSECNSLTTLDLSPLNTSQVITMEKMFTGCNSLTTLDLSPLDTSKVTNMSFMFNWCNSLTTLDLSPLDTSQVTTMFAMFANCSSLTTLDLSPLDTSRVIDIASMFAGCSNLTSLNLNNLNTSKAPGLSSMFYECSKLTTTINITNPNVENYNNMFSKAATLDGAQITVNYTAETSDLVDRMLATKSEDSNVVKGSLIS